MLWNDCQLSWEHDNAELFCHTQFCRPDKLKNKSDHIKRASVDGRMEDEGRIIRPRKLTEGVVPLLSATPPITLSLTGPSGVKGGPPHYSHRLPASSCLHSQLPSVHPSSLHPTLLPPLQPLITDLSCHHTHIPCHTAVWLMRPLLIMASGPGVSALSLDTIKAVLLQRRKTLGRQTGSSVRRYGHR